MSKYAAREEAARDTLYLVEELVRVVEEAVKPRLEAVGKWSGRHEEALKILKQALAEAEPRRS